MLGVALTGSCHDFPISTAHPPRGLQKDGGGDIHPGIILRLNLFSEMLHGTGIFTYMKTIDFSQLCR